mgnify:CR=1 FL=1
MAGKLDELWKYGTRPPLVGEIPTGGFAIDILGQIAYSSDGVEIFPLGGGGVTPVAGDQNVDGGRADTIYTSTITIDGGGA